MSKTEKICIVMPAFNESAIVGRVVKDTYKASERANLKVDIIVVNDGSSDDTANVAREAGALVISHVLNAGEGGATATGLSYANQKGYSIAATMDADGQHDPQDTIRGINLMRKGRVDLLIGSRLIGSGAMPRKKIIGNKGLSLITYLLFGIGVTDSQSGLRIFSKKALDQLKWRTSGYEYASEMLWRAKQIGLFIDEYPIRAIYTDYSKNKGQNNWNAVIIIKSLIKRRLVELFE